MISFKQEMLLMLVRWYAAYALSYRDIEELALSCITCCVKSSISNLTALQFLSSSVRLRPNIARNTLGFRFQKFLRQNPLLGVVPRAPF